MKYELIIFDIGKTLYDKNLSPRASDCVLHDIEALRKKGIKVGVCTMRTIQHCREVVPVELDFYISLNGSYVVCAGEVIVNKPTTIPSGHIDFLSYGKNFTCYSTEKAKMLAAMKEEKHYSFNFEKLQPEYIPTVGDVVIVWDDNSKENAVVGVMNEMDKTVRPYKINDGTWYGNCDKFVSEEQYKNLIDGKE